MSEVLLDIRGLSIGLQQEDGVRDLLRDVSLNILPQETVSLLGGSGGGKTSLGLAILGLLPSAMKVHNGKILFLGQDLLSLQRSSLRRLRGKEISMIFQEPLSAFNPVFRIGDQIAEVVQEHTDHPRAKIMDRVCTLLDMVEIPEPRRVASAHPHQLSAGLRQRAMIAQAIAASPKVIIADEPTSNLDVTVQARIIELFAKLKKQLSLSLLLITHDLGLVKAMSDRVFILYEGRIVEQGNTQDVLSHAHHDFTKRLITTISL
ncbi:MAG TPA: ABC transporter ATP-binding protein [Candidatus Omnitrophota bacterium]|nr:ABC transporter ATP-binding protein [Candidatus Omnitrophota bacterium]